MLIKRIFQNDLSIEQRLLDCYTLSENTIVNNAYYDPSNNAMVINIPNLQEEVLKLDSSDAFNYAILGATTIGHELCHAFDSSGAQYGLMEKAWNGGQFLTNSVIKKNRTR